MEITRIGIAGSGTMGAGIGQILAQHGYQVVIVDLEERFLEIGRDIIRTNLDTLQRHGLINSSDIERVERNMSFSTSLSDFSGAQLIIEAIVEKLAIKQDFWKQVEPLVDRTAILASNTSGLSINAMSRNLAHPERFIGLHFWNPPHLIPLVELIKGDHTGDEVVAVLEELCRTIGKESVVVLKDAPGFIGNRLQFAVIREALHILEEGIASAEDIDKAMRFGPGFRYPHLGPLATADLGGLDVFYDISSYLNASLSDRHDVSPLLKAKVERGELGTKTNQGFYDYPGDAVRQAMAERDEKLFAQLKLTQKKRLSDDKRFAGLEQE